MQRNAKKILIALALYAASDDVMSNPSTDQEPAAYGNFALPTSQQPGPFLSFGQNILDKHQIQLTMLASELRGNDQDLTNYTPGYLYQITDATSLLFSLPIATDNHSGGTHSAGMVMRVFSLNMLFIPQIILNSAT